MAALSGWEAGGRELKRLDGIRVNPVKPFTPGINGSAGIPGAGAVANPFQNGLSVVARGDMGSSSAQSQGVTPIGKFAVVLLLFALAIFFLPKGVRGWFVIIILLGALTVNPGAIKEFQQWTGV